MAGMLEMPVAGETELVERLRRRDGAAFEALVAAEQDRVYDFCFRMLGDAEEASDLTQDVFVAAHAHLPAFREDAKLSTWLFRIAKNHCLNRLKYLARRGRGRREGVEALDEPRWSGVLDAPPRADEVLIAEGERRRVQAAIASLDHDQRLLVALRDLEGLTYEEIVEIAELPLGTVKSRLHRARERLARILEGPDR